MVPPSKGGSAAGLLALAVVNLASSQQCPAADLDTVSLLQGHISVANRLGLTGKTALISHEDAKETTDAIQTGPRDDGSQKGRRHQSEEVSKKGVPKHGDGVRRIDWSWWAPRPKAWVTWLLPVGICAAAVAAFLISQLVAISSLCSQRRNPQALAAGEAAIAKEYQKETFDDKPALDMSPSLWAWLTLAWANPLFRGEPSRQDPSLSRSQSLQTIQLDDDAAAAHTLFQACWAQESIGSQGAQGVRLLQVLKNFVGWRQWLILLGLVMASFVVNCLAMVMSVELLLSYVEWLRSQTDELAAPDPFWSSLMVLTLCFAMPMAGAVLEGVLRLKDARIGVRLTAALVTAICQKLERLPVANRQSESSASPGSVQKLVTDVVDTSTNSLRTVIQCITTPVNMVFLIVLLWSRVGMSSLIVVVGFVPLVVISTKFLGAIVPARVSHQVAHEKWLLLFRNAVEAKLELKAFAWELPVMKRISEVRDESLDALCTMQNMGQQIVTVTIAWPRLVTFCVLVTFSLTNPFVDGIAVFTCLQVLGYMTYLIATFSTGTTKLHMIVPLATRIEAFLKLPEAPTSQTAQIQLEDGVGLSLKGSYAWRANDKCVLHDLQLRLPKGTLAAVVGESGSGKTSLFHAVLGELYPKSDLDDIANRGVHIAAYSAQRPWIFTDTIRENIVLGACEVDERRYAAAVQAAGLTQDIQALAEGDATMMSSQTGLLSDSQRSRISWARCAYSSEDLVLMDDDLSGLPEDPNAKNQAEILRKSLVADPLLQGRTRLVAMQPNVATLQGFDFVIVMAGGQILEHGSPSDVLETIAFKKLLQPGTPTSVAPQAAWKQMPWHAGSALQVAQDLQKHPKSTRPIQIEGSASFGTLVHILGLIGYCRAISFFWLVCIASGLMVTMDIALGQWANEADTPYEMQAGRTQGGWWLWIYAVCFIIAVSLGVVANFIGAQCSRLFSQAIHNKLAQSLVFSPIHHSQSRSCPDNHQLENIIADLSQADLSLWIKITGFVCMVCAIASPLAYVHAVLPFQFSLVALPCYLTIGTFARNYWKVLPQLQDHFVLRRFSMLEHLLDIASGVASKRAFRQEDGLVLAEERIINSYANSRFMVHCIASQWLQIRLGACFVPILTTAALMGVLQPEMLGQGTFGLVLVFCITTLQSLEIGVDSGTGAQRELAVAARLQRYANTPEDASAVRALEDASSPSFEDSSPSLSFSNTADMQSGEEARSIHVQIKSLCAGYGDHQVDVLRGLSLQIDHGQKVGVYGASGSGKSLLLQVLLRLISPRHGTVMLNGVDASKLDLKLIRSSIGFVPQDPVLLQGDVDFNMDPLSKHSTKKVSLALALVGLDSLCADVEHQPSFGLTGGHCPCPEFALRERRLLTVARMVLHQPALLLLDGVLLGLDARSKVLVQNTMQSAFADATVLAVASEPESLLDFKRVYELKQGILIECQK